MAQITVRPTPKDSWWQSAPLAGDAGAVADQNAINLTRNDPAPITGPRNVPVPSTGRVWGDDEAAAAGLYETPQSVAADDSWWQSAPKVQQAMQPAQPSPEPEQPPSREPAAMVPGLARSFIGQGVAAGFGDEIEAFARSKFNGTDYEQELAGIRGELKQFQDENPVVSTGAEIGGAIATSFIPGMAAARGANIASQIGRGALSGAAYGGAYGAGTGETDDERLAGALTGVATGGLTGGAAPAVIAGAANVGDRALAPIRALTSSGADREAARRVGRAANIDMASARPGLTAQEFAEAQGRNQPVTNLERGGEMTRALADSAATTSPTARAVLGRTIDARVEGQGARTTEFLRDLARTPGNASATREQLQEAANRARRGYYERAFAQGRVGLWSDDLARMSESPAMQQAQLAARDSIRNKQASGRSIGALNPQTGHPTLEFWDQVKRQLDSRYSVLSRQGDREAAADILSMKKELVARLDQAFPAYREARGVAASFFGADDALEAGEKFVMSSHKLQDASRALQRMTPEERDLFREGFISSLVEKVEQTGDRFNVVPKIWGTKASRDKINLVLGPQKARELEAFMHVETLMNSSRSVLGGSPTARRLTELGLAGGTYGIATGGNILDPNPTALGNAALVFALTRGKFKIDNRIATKVAEQLASDNPAVFQRGIQMVANNSRLLNAVRNATPLVAGQQTVSQTQN